MSYCNWANANPKMKHYHDHEWGVPVWDDQKLFEHLMLEVLQCGLSWNLILQRREVFRQCLDNFDYEKIARYGQSDIERIMACESMIHNLGKVKALISNAQAFIRIRQRYGSFADWMWAHSGHQVLCYTHHADGLIPATNGLAEKMAKELKGFGFKYTGPITVYSHLQACGMVNDHGKDCLCYRQIIAQYPTVVKRRYKEKGITQF